MMERGYRVFDHTADVGLEAWGRTPSEAFVAAAHGMFAIMLGTEPERQPSSRELLSRTIEVHGGEWGELLVNWLAELLYLFEVDALVAVGIEMQQCVPPRCVASIEGIALTRLDDLTGVGVKAVTYHELDVNVAPERTSVRVIFDI